MRYKFRINDELVILFIGTFVFLCTRYFKNFTFDFMFYNSDGLPVGNNNMNHRMKVDSGLHKTKFYDVFYHIKLTVAPLPIKNPLAHCWLTSFLTSFNWD